MGSGENSRNPRVQKLLAFQRMFSIAKAQRAVLGCLRGQDLQYTPHSQILLKFRDAGSVLTCVGNENSKFRTLPGRPHHRKGGSFVLRVAPGSHYSGPCLCKEAGRVPEPHHPLPLQSQSTLYSERGRLLRDEMPLRRSLIRLALPVVPHARCRIGTSWVPKLPCAPLHLAECLHLSCEPQPAPSRSRRSHRTASDRLRRVRP